jgi:hypothetical protein
MDTRALGGCCYTGLVSTMSSGPYPYPLPRSPGDEVYSTIRKQEYNGKIPRFRRIRGENELYTSDTVMQSESGSG